MSKIVEALERMKSEIADLVLPAIASEWVDTRASLNLESGIKEPSGNLAVDRSQARVDQPEAAEPWNDALVRTMTLDIPQQSPLLPFDSAHSRASEQYRIARARIVQHALAPSVILISSGAPGDGKTLTAVNIAGAMALKADSKVLLVDADLRRSRVHSYLQIDQAPGLANVLDDSASISEATLRTKQIPNLYIMPAGDAAGRSPAELLDSERWRACAASLRTMFRYVIIDSPPIASVADYELLQAASDGILLVVRPDHTKKNAWTRAIQLVSQKKLIGVILNCAEDWFVWSALHYDSSSYYS
jgi:capsular exopolysaccharide synthesis family protein